MKRRKIILFFLLSFIGGFVALVLLYKNFTIKSKGPLSWQEIYNDLNIFLLVSFVCAIFITFRHFVKNHSNKKNK